MKEPIFDDDELTHAARALLMAVIGAPHEIECNSVTVHFDSKKPGHNALNQMSRRIESELAALLEKLCGEPVAWILPDMSTREFTGTTLTRSASIAERHGGQPLYRLKEKHHG